MGTPAPEELLGFLRRVIGKEFEVPADEIRPEARLVQDLGLDSVDAMVLALRVEEETGLELSDDELKSLDTVASVAVRAHTALGLRDLSRTDAIVTPDGTVQFLEVNVSPGMTETSLLPMAVEAAGLELGAVCAKLLRRAASR